MSADRHPITPLANQPHSGQTVPTTVELTGPSQSVDWYHEGESRTVEVAGVKVTVRLVGRKGRRSRIAIVAPTGAKFWGSDAEGFESTGFS